MVDRIISTSWSWLRWEGLLPSARLYPGWAIWCWGYRTWDYSRTLTGVSRKGSYGTSSTPMNSNTDNFDSNYTCSSNISFWNWSFVRLRTFHICQVSPLSAHTLGSKYDGTPSSPASDQSYLLELRVLAVQNWLVYGLIDHPLIRQYVGLQFFVLTQLLFFIKSQRFLYAVYIVVGCEVYGLSYVETMGKAAMISLHHHSITLRKVKT